MSLYDTLRAKRMLKGYLPDYAYNQAYPNAGPQTSASVWDKSPGIPHDPQGISAYLGGNLPGATSNFVGPKNRTGNPQAQHQLSGNWWNEVGGPQAAFPSVSPLGFMQGALEPHAQAHAQIVNNVMPQAPAANGFNLGALLTALNAPRGRHFGIGGAEVTEANPFGNSGGDPFKNGFFKPQPTTPGMMFLSGTSRPNADQLGLMNWSAMNHRQPTPGVNLMPPQGAVASVGSPVWRQQNPGFNLFSDENFGQVPGTTRGGNIKNKQAFWSAMGM